MAWCTDVLTNKPHPRFDIKILSKKVRLIRQCLRYANLKGLSEWSKIAFFFSWCFFFVSEIFKFSYYASLVTDDVIGCASTVVWHKIKNISAYNDAMLFKVGRDVAPYEIYQLVHILMLLWQHARFQSPTSLKWSIVNMYPEEERTSSHNALRLKAIYHNFSWRHHSATRLS